MPTSRPRYQITETPRISHALDLASAHWPGESRAELLRRLVEVGGASLAHADDQEVAARKAAILSSSGGYAGAFGPDFLDDLRQDWPA